MIKLYVKLFILCVLCSFLWGIYAWQTKAAAPATLPIAKVIKQNLKVEVKTVGELEAAKSIGIASSIKGDQGKIIDLIADGVNVKPGEVLVKMDPTPFEEKLEKLRAQMKEQEAYIVALQQALEWETSQVEHENRTATYEVESAQLELNKILHGDGPQEMSRLKGAMQKAWLKYDELQAYSSDLLALEEQGFLNPSEMKQARKKLAEEQEAYEQAKTQYESYTEHVFPMQIKKAETTLKRAVMNQEETMKSGLYKIAKATAQFEQAQQAFVDYTIQLQEAKKELKQTEIIAPAPGMVVHREDYRNGQRRKPRVGDILVKNQPLIDLPDLSSMIVKTRVREVDLFKIQIGKKATIEVDAYPHLKFSGTISSIGVLAMADLGRPAEEKYFEVRIALDESDPCLRPGMTTRVVIHAQQAENALTVPLHALFDEHKQTFCYFACSQNQFEKREIKLGISNEQWAEVKEGLQEGDCVCLMNPLD